MHFTDEIDNARLAGLIAVWAGSLAVFTAFILLLWRMTP